MLIVYNGPDEGRRLAPAHGGTYLPRGESVEVPDPVGLSLLAQPWFSKPKRHRPVETPEQVEPPSRGSAASVHPDVETR